MIFAASLLFRKGQFSVPIFQGNHTVPIEVYRLFTEMRLGRKTAKKGGNLGAYTARPS
jgi:hypothetical protein